MSGASSMLVRANIRQELVAFLASAVGRLAAGLSVRGRRSVGARYGRRHQRGAGRDRLSEELSASKWRVSG